MLMRFISCLVDGPYRQVWVSTRTGRAKMAATWREQLKTEYPALHAMSVRYRG